jgi:hypothetical protein
MKYIILFGFGKSGQRFLSAYIKGSWDFKIVAVADNFVEDKKYNDIPIIKPSEIKNYKFDGIWICTIYDKEIKEQLISDYGIEEYRIRRARYPLDFLEGRILKKYSKEISGEKKCLSDELQEVIDYISSNGVVRMYCYHFYDKYIKMDVPVYFDEELQRYYGVVYSKRMYMPMGYTKESSQNYLREVLAEQDILSPHRYLSDSFHITGGIGIDVGAAEGIFALEVIEKIEHIYLVESDDGWIEALKYTFKGYKDKVTIIKAFVSDKSQDVTMRLDDLIGNQRIDFIKMDIEGNEIKALNGCREIIERCYPKLAVCSYHHKNDSRDIKEWLEKFGYAISQSYGYVICHGEWELDVDETDFRKALIWAGKDSE